MIEKSALELYARELAEIAADWAHQNTNGRTPAWADMGWQAQDNLASGVLSQVAIQHAACRIPFPQAEGIS
jgi:hypothetical protein